MDCPSCHNPYKASSPSSLPRVLLHCGHTFCHSCLTARFSNNSVLCFICNKNSQAASVDVFPVNQTLVKIMGNVTPRVQGALCKMHGKKIDIFCEKDQKLICSQCIIQGHQHHKMVTVSQKAQKQRITLNDNLKKIKQTLEQYKSSQLRAESEQIQIEHAFLDCQAEANLFYQTIQEEIIRLKNKEIEKLKSKKEEALKKLSIYREELIEQITFLSQIQCIYTDLSQLQDAQFLMQEDKRTFISDSSKSKRPKYTPFTLQFKKSNCLQQISKSLQQMQSLQNNRNNAVSSSFNFSPSLKKQKEPAVLEVNLKQQYQRRKGIPPQPQSKNKPAKKTITIHSDRDRQRIGESHGARNGSLNVREEKIQTRLVRESSVKRPSNIEDMDSSVMSIGDMSNSFTPISSVKSFMQSSRKSFRSDVDSFFQQTTLKNSFHSFSAMTFEDTIYHFGGLTNGDTQKYYPQTGTSQRVTSNSTQFKRRGFGYACVKVGNNEKCLLIGGVNSNKNNTSDVYQFHFKDQKITKSVLKISQPRSSFGCVVRNQEIYIMGGKTHDKPLNTFQKYKIQGNRFQVTKMPSMGQSREDLSACLGFDDNLYVFGGITLSNDATTSVQRYNFVRQSWQTLPPMRFPRISFESIATPKGIFILGGHTTKKYLRQVQFFPYEQSRWFQMSPMLSARCYHSAVLSKDYQTITVFGGFYENNQLDCIQIYQIGRNVWRNGGKMRQKRCLHVSVSR